MENPNKELEDREKRVKEFVAKAKPGEELEFEDRAIGDGAVERIRKVVTKL